MFERAKLLEQQTGLKVNPKTLTSFYHRHGIRYRAVGYRYQQAPKVSPVERIQAFTVDLARRIRDKENLVYIDETATNMWIRKRYTWSTRDRPVKMVLNQDRGHGVTIYGAIGEYLPRAVFMTGKSTNTKEFAEFLRLLRMATPAGLREKLVIVLDNHKSHHNPSIVVLAKNLNFELLYLPTYTPQLNPIESLWSVVKGKLKKKLQEKQAIRLKQSEFEEELTTILENVTCE